MKAIDLGLIQARRARLDEQIAVARESLEALEAKRSELDIAERVFAELATENGETGATASQQQASASESPLATESRASKPRSIPHMSKMILEALHHAQSLGAVGLEPAGMVSFIRGRYWPTCPPERVGPIAWRMWSKDGTLEKRGTLYALPNGERPSNAGERTMGPAQKDRASDSLLEGV